MMFFWFVFVVERPAWLQGAFIEHLRKSSFRASAQDLIAPLKSLTCDLDQKTESLRPVARFGQPGFLL